ncbi:MAG TPA: 2OG-Fe(II) oxygenase, partial [Burkholderiales bacterium]|nr:2OG-Fe(II) oxygenase [Burkholderiales bacterium]
PQAMTALGAQLVVGRDAPYSPVDGAALIADAAQQGDAEAWRHLAVLAGAGVGRSQSWSDAFNALARACELGDQHGIRQTGLLQEMNCGTPEAARAWVASAATRELHATPRLIACADFLTPALCAYLIERARGKLVPAQVNDAGGAGLKLDPMRTNTCAVYSIMETDLVIQLIRARIAHTADVAASAFEPPEVLHYSVGETYKPHVDFFHPRLPNFSAEMQRKGQRIKTCLVYLNDDLEGGETDFPRLGIRFRGRTGEALIFDNVTTAGTGDMKTMHTGLPPTRGEKWLLSQWIRSKPQRVA